MKNNLLLLLLFGWPIALAIYIDMLMLYIFGTGVGMLILNETLKKWQ